MSNGRPKEVDPLQLAKKLWPHIRFYKQQEQIIYSVQRNNETVVAAGNKLGKDFVSAFIVLWFFLTRVPCRIVTTSAKDDHLDVLWGEIHRFIAESAYPLRVDEGGPLIVLSRELRRIYKGQECPLSYVKGMVASPDRIAAMQGHHIAMPPDGRPMTLFVSDESSSVPDDYYKKCDTWAHRKLIIGNTWPCENFFKRAIAGDPARGIPGGDIPAKDGDYYYRKVIRITAEDSPNIRLARLEIAQGKKPSGRILVPGVKIWDEYQREQLLWDEIQKAVSHRAEFYEGAEVKMFPPEWLEKSAEIAERLGPNGLRRGRLTMGVDSAEGGDKTAWAICSEYGLVELIAQRTPDTVQVVNQTIALARRWNISPTDIVFDRGGGGKQHADRLRALGYQGVRTVGFGESATPERRAGRMPLKDRRLADEARYAYVNRRGQLYGTLRQRLDPSSGQPFAIPRQYGELRRQLSVIPLTYDEEGRLVILPKTRKQGSNRPSLTDLVGHSPDEADALTLAVWAQSGASKAVRPVAGAIR